MEKKSSHPNSRRVWGLKNLFVIKNYFTVGVGTRILEPVEDEDKVQIPIFVKDRVRQRISV